jgi:hypothetical protein
MFKLKKRWPAGEKHGTKKRECEKTMAPWAQKTSSCALKLYLSCAYELPCGVSSSANRSFSQVSLQQKFEHFHKRGYYRGRDGEWKQLRKRGKRGGKPKPSKPRQNHLVAPPLLLKISIFKRRRLLSTPISPVPLKIPPPLSSLPTRFLLPLLFLPFLLLNSPSNSMEKSHSPDLPSLLFRLFFRLRLLPKLL